MSPEAALGRVELRGVAVGDARRARTAGGRQGLPVGAVGQHQPAQEIAASTLHSKKGKEADAQRGARAARGKEAEAESGGGGALLLSTCPWRPYKAVATKRLWQSRTLHRCWRRPLPCG